MNYAEALAYLDDHASYHKTGRIDEPSLDSIARLCEAMGDPQHAQPVIHVTGTNGKGSTTQIIARLIAATGLSVGTYTSPHLERVNERIRRNGEPISDEEFGEQIGAIANLEIITGVRPTYFEAVTAAAFRWFADVAVDVAVIEVGMLGRWDATNVVDAQVAVVTNIALDHTQFAGPTLSDIAREKAGIFKPSSAAVIGTSDPELVEIFQNQHPASMLIVDDDFEVIDNALAVGGRSLTLRTPTTVYPDLYLPLHGAHQGDNAVIALTATETFFAAPLPEDVVLEGFNNVELPGRFEVLGVQPLVVVDGAHNPAGADTCASVFFDDFNPDGRRILILGTTRDPKEMLAAIRVEEFDAVHVCNAPTPLTRPASEVAAAARELGAETVTVHDSVEAACIAAARYIDADDAILATGSLYVVGEARPALKAHAN